MLQQVVSSLLVLLSQLSIFSDDKLGGLICFKINFSQATIYNRKETSAQWLDYNINNKKIYIVHQKDQVLLYLEFFYTE